MQRFANYSSKHEWFECVFLADRGTMTEKALWKKKVFSMFVQFNSLEISDTNQSYAGTLPYQGTIQKGTSRYKVP